MLQGKVARGYSPFLQSRTCLGASQPLVTRGQVGLSPGRLNGRPREGPVSDSLELLLGLNSDSGVPAVRFLHILAVTQALPSPRNENHHGVCCLGTSHELTSPLSGSSKETFLSNQALR